MYKRRSTIDLGLDRLINILLLFT